MKTKTCPHDFCGGIMEAQHDENSNPIWHCRCCDSNFPRKIYATKKRQARNAESDQFCEMIDDLLGRS